MKPIFASVAASIFIIASLCSCSNSGSGTADADTTDQLITTPISTDDDSSRAFGYYTGILPCNDCEGIRQQLLISPGSHFHFEENYMGKNAAPLIAEGEWEYTSDSTFQLKLKDSIIGIYRLRDSGLVYLGQAGVPINEQMANDYFLRKVNIGADNRGWQKLRNSGVDLLVLGNEPFWSLQINRGRQVVFTLADRAATPDSFDYADPQIGENNAVFNFQQNNRKLRVVISRGFCSDGMSDTWYEYKADLWLNDTAYRGCGVALTENGIF